MEPVESKEYSWAWVTASRLLSHGPCELISAEVVPSATTTTTILYDGVDANGDKIVQFNITVVLNWPFKPPKPVYCRKGLYLTVGSDVSGVFVQWRELGHEER